MKYISGLIIVFFMVILSGCSTNRIFSHAVKQGIVIDGNYDDWQGVKPFLVKDPPFLVASANASDYLFLVLRSNDATFMRQLRMFGFTLWLNKDKSTGLELPTRFRAQNKREEAAYRTNRQKMRGPGIPLHSGDFFLRAYPFKEQTPLSALPRFAIASGYQNGINTIEFKIPILKKGVSGYGVRIHNGKIFIGLQWKMTSVNKMRRMGGTVRRGRGGMGREGNDGYRPRKQRMIREENLWFTILLDN